MAVNTFLQQPAFGLSEVDVSPQILSHFDYWPIDDSPLKDYSMHAYGFSYPNKLLEMLKDEITDNGVGIDVCGGHNGVAMQRLLDEGLLQKGLVTNYLDKRADATRQREDLDHLSGDIKLASTWAALHDWQMQHAADGVDLVLHFPFGALQQLPVDFYRGAAHALIDLLCDGGILLTKIPTTLKGNPDSLDAVADSIVSRDDVASAQYVPGFARRRYAIIKRGTNPK